MSGVNSKEAEYLNFIAVDISTDRLGNSGVGRLSPSPAMTAPQRYTAHAAAAKRKLTQNNRMEDVIGSHWTQRQRYAKPLWGCMAETMYAREVRKGLQHYD